MERTKIYIPTSLRQAEDAFLNRFGMFEGLAVGKGQVSGFKTRAEAVAAGLTKSVFHFAVLHLSVAPAIAQMLTEGEHMSEGYADNGHGRVWKLTSQGTKLLSECGFDLTMEIVPNRRRADH